MEIIFENWEAVLRVEVPPDRQRLYREAIVKFRYWLRETGKPPVEETFKAHLDWKKSYLTPERFAVRQDALRWYYKAGRRNMQSESAQRPPSSSTRAPAKPSVTDG